MPFDCNKSYVSLDEGSDAGCKGADFVEQDGMIYGWSESNFNYEIAWWLYSTGTSPILKKLRGERWPDLTKASDDARTRIVYGSVDS